MRAVFFLAVVLALTGCGSAPRRPVVTRPDPNASAREDRIAEQESTIRELEGRLALAEGEARDLRFEMERAATTRPTEPVTIGARDEEDWHEPGEADPELEEPEAEEPIVEEAEPSGPRPVLRLYGTPQPTYADPMAMPPPISTERLPVTDAAPLVGQAPLPFGIPAATGPVTPPPFVRRDAGLHTGTPPFVVRPADDVRDRYRTALRAFRDRRFDAAHDLLDRIVRENGEHELARSARYWRAEALYSLGQYARARAEFEAILRAEPRGTKTPDVLLKIGLCHMRLGERSEARRFFDRLRTEFPSSSAVRLIEEGST
jgi:tol-pal system protein YbgF